MENKINIAELLKDCPQGMELDCSMFENVTFEEVITARGFDDKKRVKILLSTHYSDGTKDEISLTEFGTYTDDETAKCVIFPKGKTSWEGFNRPFKDGDIIVYTSRTLNFIAILQEIEKDKLSLHCCYGLNDAEFHVDVYNTDNHKIALASEEQKIQLFQVIKDNGYRWNTETKTLSKEDTNDKVVMASIYFDKEYYDDEVELHLGNYEIEIRDGKTYAIFKNQETKIMEKLIKPEFKAGDRIKDTRNNSEGIILKITDKGFECRFEYGIFLVSFDEQDYFNLVPNKSDITSNMEEINIDWCKQHGMILSQVNVASDTSYYLETNGYTILVYTKSTTGNQKLNVINPISNKEIEFSVSRLNRDLNKLNSITTDDLRKLCELVNLDYPFKS